MQRFTADSWILHQSGVNDDNSSEDLKEIALEWNNTLASLSSVEERLGWLQRQGKKIVMSSSFGIHSNLMLHLVDECIDDKIPVIWVDTGYCPPETYEFVETLHHRYNFNLKVYQSLLTPARMEYLHGKLWEDPSVEAHKLYGKLRKVEPMERALAENDAQVILTGLRASQTSHRANMQLVNIQKGRLKVCPILDWIDSDVVEYFEKKNLSYHPLYYKGYQTVGDAHSSSPALLNDNARSTRFHGVAEECGLHIDEDETDVKVPSTSDAVEFHVYGKPSCQYCVKSKELLKAQGRSFTEYTVGSDISIKVLRNIVGKSDITRVPQIMYRGGTYIGGYEDLQRWLTNSEVQQQNTVSAV